MYTLCAHSVTQLHPTLCNPMDCSPPGLLSMGFPRQEYWTGLPFPPLGDLPNSGTEPASPASPALAGGFFYHCATWTCDQSWPTLCDPMNHSPPGSSVHGIFQARILEWVAISFSTPGTCCLYLPSFLVMHI